MIADFGQYRIAISLSWIGLYRQDGDVYARVAGIGWLKEFDGWRWTVHLPSGRSA